MCNSLIIKDILIKAITHHTFLHKLAVKKNHLPPSGISVGIHGNKYWNKQHTQNNLVMLNKSLKKHMPFDHNK